MILRSPVNLFMLVGMHTSLRADGREAQSRLRGPAMGTKWHWKTAFKKYCPPSHFSLLFSSFPSNAGVFMLLYTGKQTLCSLEGD